MNALNTASNTKSNFGAKGWLMIFFAGIFFFFYAGFCTDGLNVIVEFFAEEHGLDANYVLGLTTPASWFGMAGAILWAIFAAKKGVRLGALITGILGGICYMLYGVVATATGFFVVTALCNFMGMGYCWTIANALMASWFPTKKGLALGWATMGQNIASASFVAIFIAFMGFAHLNGTFFIYGGILVAAGILAYIFIRNTPEELGCSPDNGQLSPEELKENRRQIEAYKSPWTVKVLLLNKQIWQIGIGYGIYVLVTVSLISRLIPRLIAGGWAPSRAISMMTVAALLGLVGSYATGWLDQKIGPKRTGVLYGLWYLGALICCIVPANDIALSLSIFFTGIGIGGIGNLFPSMTATVFGRLDFVRAMGILNPITNIVRSFAFIIISFGLAKLNGYSSAYLIIAVLDIIAIIIIGTMSEKQIGSLKTIE